MTVPQDDRSPARQLRQFEATNHDDDIDQFFAVQATGATHDEDTGQNGVNIELPTSDDPESALIAGNFVQTAKSGYETQVSFDFPLYLKYDAQDGTPANGEEWGPDQSGKLRKGKFGFIVIGDADTDREVVLVNRASGTKVIRFILNAALVLSGTAAAFVCDIAWQATATAITVRDPFTDPGEWQGYVGYRGWAILGAQGVYDIVYMEEPALFIEFTLLSGLSGGSANATTTDYFQGKSLGDQIVYDPQGLFPRAIVGAKGKAVWDDRARRYEVIICQQIGTLFWCDVNSDFCPDASSVAITYGNHYQHSIFNQDPNPVPTTANNFYHLAGQGGDRALIAYDSVNDVYDLIQVEPHLAEIPTEFRVLCKEDGTAKFQMKGEKHYDYYCNELFDWKDAGDIGVPADNVVSVTWDGTDLYYTYESQLVLCTFDTGDITIDTPEACPTSP